MIVIWAFLKKRIVWLVNHPSSIQMQISNAQSSIDQTCWSCFHFVISVAIVIEINALEQSYSVYVAIGSANLHFISDIPT